MRPKVSVVVLSHNYAQFLRTAIDSALAQLYPVEVLVVDDGSTDSSRAIIDGYDDRVARLYKENGGNSSVVNAAVRRTTGDIVMFLDADDLLRPEAAGEVAAAWTPECAKVQFRLTLIDADGHRTGVDPPPWVPMPSGDVVPQLLATGRYVTPVMTGNAFSRRVLDALLPIPEEDFRNTNDGYLNPLAPFHGPVVSVERELGCYRLHGRNLWAFSGGVTVEGMRQRLVYDLMRCRYVAETARARSHDMPAHLPLKDPLHVLQRLASLRLDRPGHPVPEDRILPLLAAGLRAVRQARGLPAPERALLAAALPAVALLPTAIAERAAAEVLSSRPRPEWLRALARRMRSLS
ncbi:MAG: glycosyltransferase [Actinomycetota bacterium]|nr:glycosyltransferase [Actinomycetota bacterium]